MFATVLLALAQQQRPPEEPLREGELRSPRESYAHQSHASENAIEVALQDETFWAAYTRRFDAGRGEIQVGVMGSDQDELVGTVRVMRFVDGSLTDGRTGDWYFGAESYELGVGLGLYALRGEEPDVDAQALTLMGSVGVTLGESQVVRAVADVAFAPDVSTFGDGDQLLDLWVRLEYQLSESAQAFVGYRSLEVELSEGGERDLGESIQIGVRLGW